MSGSMKAQTKVRNVNLPANVDSLLTALGVSRARYQDGMLNVHSPVNGETIGQVKETSHGEAVARIEGAHAAFHAWRLVPAPRRGELVRLLGEELRVNKEIFARLVSIEVGKAVSESLRELEETIDICDFGVGISQQLYSLTTPAECGEHQLMESWHPLGVTGIISAFDRPLTVWAQNAALALVCGNSVVWKPSEKTPLIALAMEALLERALKRFNREGGVAPEGLSAVLFGGCEIGEVVVDYPKVALVSATGSMRMGRAVGPRLARRFARALLQLGGNNTAIVTPTADVDLALRGVAVAAIGTAGQRCTTLRRLFVHESVYDTFVPRLKRAYASVMIGDPLETGTMVGPLINGTAYRRMQEALEGAKAVGGTIHGGERVLIEGAAEGYYVGPALVEIGAQKGPADCETFVPILYVMKYRDLDSVLELHNAVSQRVSSSIFTNDPRETETFLSACGSDCGLATVNIGPLGAEICGAGKAWGRRSGSDAWKAYMRRAHQLQWKTAARAWPTIDIAS